jgi:VWFA-related protein
VNTGLGRLNAAREAANKFIHKGLDPGERVGIFTNSNALTLDFTDDLQKLLDTLAKLRKLQRMPDQSMGACPLLTPVQAWEILHGGQNADTRNPNDQSAYGVAIRMAKNCGCKYDPANCVQNEAQYLVGNAQGHSLDTFESIIRVIHHLGDMPGRRILVLTSSGFLTLSLQQDQQKVIEAALRSSVVINSLDAEGLPAFSDPWSTHYMMSFPMADMAAGTGGEFIHNNNDLAGGLEALAAVPSVSYVLGFSPTDLKVDGTEHKLKVQLTASVHLTVSARPGYYAPSPELSASQKRFRKLEQSVMATDDPAEIAIEFSATPETLKSGDLSLKVLVHVDTRKLPFEVLSERHTERLIFITALFDAKNKFLSGVQGVMDLRLKEATLKQISAQGLDAKLSISAPAGLYRVREVVQEAVGGHITAISREVTIR